MENFLLLRVALIFSIIRKSNKEQENILWKNGMKVQCFIICIR